MYTNEQILAARPSKQETFDLIVAHLRSGKGRCIAGDPKNAFPLCAYKNDAGNNCAVGVVMTSDEHELIPGLAGNIDVLRDEFSTIPGTEYPLAHLHDMLSALQGVHDTRYNWDGTAFVGEEQLAAVAAHYGVVLLSVPTVPVVWGIDVGAMLTVVEEDGGNTHFLPTWFALEVCVKDLGPDLCVVDAEPSSFAAKLFQEIIKPPTLVLRCRVTTNGIKLYDIDNKVVFTAPETLALSLPRPLGPADLREIGLSYLASL